LTWQHATGTRRQPTGALLSINRPSSSPPARIVLTHFSFATFLRVYVSSCTGAADDACQPRDVVECCLCAGHIRGTPSGPPQMPQRFETPTSPRCDTGTRALSSCHSLIRFLYPIGVAWSSARRVGPDPSSPPLHPTWADVRAACHPIQRCTPINRRHFFARACGQVSSRSF